MTASGSEAMLRRFADAAGSVITLDLERMPALMARLGDPHLRLPPVIHIAGTNGKGSTLAFLKAMLVRAGKRVQAFTSPSLRHLTEEVVLAAGEISDRQLTACLAQVAAQGADLKITPFEALTAAGFLAFAEDEADFLLLETGMGGRLDATNIAPAPKLVIITPIAGDHTAFLGSDIAEIAAHKAGIIKPGAVCIANPQHEEAIAVVSRRARELAVPLRLLGRDFGIDAAGRWHGLSEFGLPEFELPDLGLIGAHQTGNAALALAALESLDAELLPDAAAALAEVVWPGRMQLIRPASPEIWTDGGHNAHAAAALVRTLKAMPPRELVLIVAMLDSRLPEEFLAPFCELAPSIIATPLPGKPVYAAGEGMAPAQIAAAAQKLGMAGQATRSLDEALGMVNAAGANPQCRVLLTGSLNLAGVAPEAVARRRPA